MKFKFVSEINEKSATILLNGTIGKDFSGAAWANELKYLNDNHSSLKEINVSINSPGGKVFDGYSMVTAVKDSKIPVNTHIDGLAASMALNVAVMGKKRYISDYGLGMAHDPFDEKDEAPQEVVDLMKSSLMKILCGQTGIDEKTMSNMMTVETWLSPEKAKMLGFVDEIKNTGRTFNRPTTTDKQEIYSFYNTIEKPTEKTLKNQNMKKVTSLLNLSSEASENAIAEGVESLMNELKEKGTSIETLKNEKTALTTERDALKTKIEGFENEAKVAKTKEITTLIENAVKDGKIKEADKAAWVKVAEIDIENAKATLASLGKTTKAANITNDAGIDTKGKATAAPKGREDWTIRDWEKKDAKGLLNMKNQTPETYQELYDAFYNEVKEKNDAKTVVR